MLCARVAARATEEHAFPLQPDPAATADEPMDIDQPEPAADDERKEVDEEDEPLSLGMLRHAIGAIGESCARQQIARPPLNTDYLIQQHLEGNLFDTFLARRTSTSKSLLDLQGISIQVKTVLEGSPTWHGRQDDWPKYQGGLIVHVWLSSKVFKRLLPSYINNEPIPTLTQAEHDLNRYYMLPVNRPADPRLLEEDNYQQLPSGINRPRAVLLEPYMHTGYQLTGSAVSEYNKRFSAENCYPLTYSTAAADLQQLFATADYYQQFQLRSFVESQQLCGKDHVVEHTGTALLAIIFNFVQISPFLICKAGVGPDALINGCSVEIKCASLPSFPLGTLTEKDFRNLRSGDVRMLLVHRLHWGDELEDERTKVILIPHTLFKDGTINESNYQQKEILSRVEKDKNMKLIFDLTIPSDCKRMNKVLFVNQNDDETYIERLPLIEPNFEHVTAVNYAYEFIGLDSHVNALSGQHHTAASAAIAIKQLIKDAHALLKANKSEFSKWPKEFMVPELKDNGTIHQVPFTMPSGRTSEARRATDESRRQADGWPKNTATTCPGCKGRHKTKSEMSLCVRDVQNGYRCQCGGCTGTWWWCAKGTYQPRL